MNNLKIKTLKCICNARKAIYDKEYEKADKLLAESIEVLRELWGEKDDSGWKYVSDGDLPDDNRDVEIGTIGSDTSSIGYYVETINRWSLKAHIEKGSKVVYCWRELPQLPPVR